MELARVEGHVISHARAVKVTAGLSAFGAVVGAAAGAAALFLGTLFTGVVTYQEVALLAVPATIGAALGAILTPIAGWMLLRRVPLGRAFAGLAAGTVVGGVFGWLFTWQRMDPTIGSVGAAVAGFLVAAVAMRYSKRARIAAAE